MMWSWAPGISLKTVERVESVAEMHHPDGALPHNSPVENALRCYRGLQVVPGGSYP